MIRQDTHTFLVFISVTLGIVAILALPFFSFAASNNWIVGGECESRIKDERDEDDLWKNGYCLPLELTQRKIFDDVVLIEPMRYVITVNENSADAKDDFLIWRQETINDTSFSIGGGGWERIAPEDVAVGDAGFLQTAKNRGKRYVGSTSLIPDTDNASEGYFDEYVFRLHFLQGRCFVQSLEAMTDNFVEARRTNHYEKYYRTPSDDVRYTLINSHPASDHDTRAQTRQMLIDAANNLARRLAQVCDGATIKPATPLTRNSKLLVVLPAGDINRAREELAISTEIEFIFSDRSPISIVRNDIFGNDILLVTGADNFSRPGDLDPSMFGITDLSVGNPIGDISISRIESEPDQYVFIQKPQGQTILTSPWLVKFFSEKDAAGRSTLILPNGTNQTKSFSELDGITIKLPIAINNAGDTAVIKFDDIALGIGADTDLLTISGNSFIVMKGRATIARPEDTASGLGVMVNTPLGAIVSDKTRFWVTHNPERGYTLVGIYEGQVSITHALTGETVTLEPNTNGEPGIAILLAAEPAQTKPQVQPQENSGSGLFWIFIFLVFGGGVFILHKTGKLQPIFQKVLRLVRRNDPIQP